MNLYVIGAAVLGSLLVTTGVGIKGYKLGQDSVIARQAKEDQIRLETLQLAQLAAAEEIAKIEVINKTIYQRATREVIKEPVYRDCVHTVDGLRAVNEALTGSAKSTGESVLSGTDTARR